MKRAKKQPAWRILKVNNPNNSSEVDAEVERHLEVLRALHKNPTFTGETVVKDGICWGRFNP